MFQLFVEISPYLFVKLKSTLNVWETFILKGPNNQFTYPLYYSKILTNQTPLDIWHLFAFKFA